jgi:tetratricopeptide (TPR) repeat protein
VSVFATAFFLLHPVHVEAVANVKHREEILATLGVAAAWLAAIRAREARAVAPVAGWAAAAGAALFLALLSKESAIVAVALIPLADSSLFSPAPSARWRRLSVSAALLAGVVAWLALRVPVVGWKPTWGTEVFFMPDEGFWTRLLTSAKVWAVYYFGRGAVLHSYPIGFSSRSEVVIEAGFPSPAAFAGLLLLAGSLFAAAAAWRRGARRWAFWILFFWITLFPSSNVLVPIGTVGAFRLLYLPSLAWGVLVGGLLNVGISKIPVASRRLAAAAAIVLPALLFAAASFHESLNWRSDATVNASDLARTRNPRARFVEAMAATDTATREEWLDEVVAIMEATPGSARGMETSLLARTYTELGDLSLARGSADAADRRAEQALAVLAPDPRFHHYRIFPQTLRARVAAARRDETAELAAWEACIASDPNYARSYLEIARIRTARGERDQAVEILQRGIAALDASGFEELRNDRYRLAASLAAIRSSGLRP